MTPPKEYSKEQSLTTPPSPLGEGGWGGEAVSSSTSERELWGEAVSSSSERELWSEAVLIALSGGPDSVLLLHRMLEDGRVGAAVHCNFHLRGAESERDERFVRDLCGRLGVRLHVCSFDTRAEAARTDESIEMAARRLRYEAFARICREKGYAAVAVAHHRDDNAETFLLNLLRGAGLKGLSGMRTEREIYGVRVIRPLLQMSRKEILDELARRGEPYVTDSTNDNVHYRRNKVRHELLPLMQQLNPQISATLCATAARLEASARLADYAVRLFRQHCTRRTADGVLRISFHALADSPAPLALLHSLLEECRFTPAQLEEALSMRVGATQQSEHYEMTRSTDHLEVRKKEYIAPFVPQPLTVAVPVPLPDGRALTLHIIYKEHAPLRFAPRRAYLDASKVQGRLHVRRVVPGDRFRPFGVTGTQLVSDYLTNHHRSRFEKAAALVVCDEAGIVWLVGERIDDRLRIDGDTQRILFLEIASDINE